MYTKQALRDRFVDGAVDTVSGPKVVVMAFDRLDRDLAGALDAIERQDTGQAHELLCHAQDLVHELLCMLDLEVWEHATSLAAVYRYVLTLLTQANVSKNATGAREARLLLAELGDGFRQAATTSNISTQPVTAQREFSARA